jgi:hypothetical protein
MRDGFGMRLSAHCKPIPTFEIYSNTARLFFKSIVLKVRAGAAPRNVWIVLK